MVDCKQCEHHRISFLGDVGCMILRDWLTHQEYKEKKVLDNCPKRRKDEHTNNRAF